MDRNGLYEDASELSSTHSTNVEPDGLQPPRRAPASIPRRPSFPPTSCRVALRGSISWEKLRPAESPRLRTSSLIASSAARGKSGSSSSSTLQLEGSSHAPRGTNSSALLVAHHLERVVYSLVIRAFDSIDEQDNGPRWFITT